MMPLAAAAAGLVQGIAIVLAMGMAGPDDTLALTLLPSSGGASSTIWRSRSSIRFAANVTRST